MTYDDLPFDYEHEDDRQLIDDEEQQYHEDCLERADDMRQELRNIYDR